MAEVPDIVINPPSSNPYKTAVRVTATALTSAADNRRIGRSYSNAVFTSHVPASRRRFIRLGRIDFKGAFPATASPDRKHDPLCLRPIPLRELSELADRIMEATPSFVYHIPTPPTHSHKPPLTLLHPCSDCASLREEVQRLRSLVQSLTITSEPRQPTPAVSTSQLEDEIELLRAQPIAFPITTLSLPNPAPPPVPTVLISRTLWQSCNQVRRALRFPGKRRHRQLEATAVAGQAPGRLFVISDSSSKSQFLVDTGAAVSIIPASPSDRRHRHFDGPALQAANKTPTTTHGERSLTLDLGLRRVFRWVFLIADVSHPIIGADVLRHYDLLVDMRHRRLTDGTTTLSVSGIATRVPSYRLNVLVPDSNSPHAV
ncbi:uncharacterized protein LOC135376420 [Ornithodoros turicata]|uniref:uncharacterized protein LOC135376420 n=1 Tax=Ornithodoros turicata TaxID=34597 RepID=UPI003138F09B